MDHEEYGDLESLRLKTVDRGQGNTQGMTARQLLGRRKELEVSHTPVFRIRKRPDGVLVPERATFEDILAIPAEYQDRILFVVPKGWEARIPAGLADSGAPAPGEDELARKTAYYASFTKEERVKEITEVRKVIDDLKKSGTPVEQKARTIMDAVERTFMVNKVSLRSKQSEVGVFEQTVANETKAFVASVFNAVEESRLASSLMECFSDLSNGQTIGHVKRVFTTMIGFLQYYSNQKHGRLGQRIRSIFARDYKDLYHRLLPELQGTWLTSDNLVHLVQFTPPDLKEFGLGAFLHDIGKMANIDYFEGDAAFDVNEIRQHVFVSSGLIIMNYGLEHERARAMAGDHHNALFHKDGYGVTRWEREKSPHGLKALERCISSDMDDFLQGKALGYLPSEMLAVVDVYDALTDASRIYKKPMTPAEALDFMHDKFVQGLKMDPVLFDLFADFLRDSGVPVGKTHGISVRLATPVV